MSSVLEKYNINPYKYLGIDEEEIDKQVIKNAYKAKCKVLHPDKTNGKTELEFKLLVVSYKAIIAGLPEGVRTSVTDDRDTEYTYAKKFSEINLDDPNTRKEYFADDDIDYENIQKEIERMEKMSTSYSSINVYKKELMDTFKKNGKFDLDKFNALFVKLKKQNSPEKGKRIAKIEDVRPSNYNDKYMRVNIHDNMIINTDNDKKKGNYREFIKSKCITQNELQELLETDTATINKLIKENKKNTGKIPKKKARELVEEKSKSISVDNSMSFSDRERLMILEKNKEIQRDKQRQKEIVERHAHIFKNAISCEPEIRRISY